MAPAARPPVIRGFKMPFLFPPRPPAAGACRGHTLHPPPRPEPLQAPRAASRARQFSIDPPPNQTCPKAPPTPHPPHSPSGAAGRPHADRAAGSRAAGRRPGEAAPVYGLLRPGRRQLAPPARAEPAPSPAPECATVDFPAHLAYFWHWRRRQRNPSCSRRVRAPGPGRRSNRDRKAGGEAENPHS